MFQNRYLALDIQGAYADSAKADQAMQAHCAARIQLDDPQRIDIERRLIIDWSRVDHRAALGPYS